MLALLLAGPVRADDAGLLHGYLRDQCLPWVTAGVAPFAGLGQAVAPADLVGIDGRMQDDALGARLLEGGRFQAAWGVSPEAEVETRFCLIDATPSGGFVMVPGTVATGVSAALAGTGLQVDGAEPTNGPGTIGWLTPGAAPYRGLRLVLVTEPGRVKLALMADDLD